MTTTFNDYIVTVSGMDIAIVDTREDRSKNGFPPAGVRNVDSEVEFEEEVAFVLEVRPEDSDRPVPPVLSQL